MKASKLLPAIAVCLTCSFPAFSGKEVDRLLEGYRQIETVTCHIRRTKEGAAGKMKFISRVYWTNKDQLHAEGITPLKRRTISNGKQLYQYVEGDPKGFSRPIGTLSEQMTISLRMVPGTAMDHLLRIEGQEETTLPAIAGSAKRIGIQTENNYVVLLFDVQDRLTGIRFFKTEKMQDLTAQYDYRDFREVAPGTWVPLTHETHAHQDKQMKFQEIVKVDRLVVNKPIAESLFIASSFFDKDIDFVDDFAKIFPE
jgi:hypothetical protein